MGEFFSLITSCLDWCIDSSKYVTNLMKALYLSRYLRRYTAFFNIYITMM